ncbi:unnamed protein product (macronuclear) [Paramecium tetraurelia]|uniref:Uncharacterized protein n=1 Tax=Paramecium tetraurelia TaxID=5888 RepID=A0C8L9_PARTE|nr:uncharacterized protein GSPATT00036270001 [Paramecium tetraurelia]CAK67136.1 unnamed protein product [Paramecium tetraurelia]
MIQSEYHPSNITVQQKPESILFQQKKVVEFLKEIKSEK